MFGTKTGSTHLLHHGPVGGGGDVVPVLPERLPGEAGAEDLDGVHHEARPDLGQRAVLLGEDLVVAEPNLAVDHGEGVHVVEEGLALRVVVRDGENLDRASVSDEHLGLETLH